MHAQALAELSEAGLSEGKVEMLWDLYTEARQAQEDRSGGAGGAGAWVAPGQPARATQGVEGAGRVGMFALGMLSRLLTVLRLMYAVSLLVAAPTCLLSKHAVICKCVYCLCMVRSHQCVRALS